MTMIDTHSWRQFLISDLFEVLLSRDDLQPQSLMEGRSRLISAGMKNNGVVKNIEVPNGTEMFSAGTITVDMFGQAFYQDEDYCAVSHGRINILQLKECVSTNTKLFVVAVLNCALSGRYAFNHMCSQERLSSDIIPLPITASGTPDWKYMDLYMTEVIERSRNSLYSLRHIKEDKCIIQSHGWKKFKIGGINGLFRIEKGTRLTRAHMERGTTPFIGASTANNGITEYVGNTEQIHPGNVITVAYNGQKATGKAFYQPSPFWASDDVHVLYPNFALNELRALFLLPIFQIIGEPYAFEDKWKVEYMEKDCLPLPVDENGNPDWAYIDLYMCKVVEESVKNLENLEQV